MTFWELAVGLSPIAWALLLCCGIYAIARWWGRRLRGMHAAYPIPDALAECAMAEALHARLHPSGAARCCALCRQLAGACAAATTDEALERRAMLLAGVGQHHEHEGAPGG